VIDILVKIAQRLYLGGSRTILTFCNKEKVLWNDRVLIQLASLLANEEGCMNNIGYQCNILLLVAEVPQI
jgi:hypothetical protein